MKIGVAVAATAVVCALAGSAGAAGDGKACIEGVKQACLEIGAGVANDEPPVGDVDELNAECGKTKDTQSCAALLREQTKASCRKGNQRACQVLGEGEARRLAEEAAPTTEELEASCKKKKQQACMDLAMRLLRDDPSAEDQKRAFALLDRSCKAGAGDGCAQLGTMLIFSGQESDAKRGMKLMKRACGLGSKAGCEFQRSFKPPRPIKVVKDADKSDGQGILGALGATEDVNQTMKNMVKLDRLLHQNCKLGYADACAEIEAAVDEDPANRKISTSAEIAAKIRKLEKQAAAGPAKK